MRLISKEEIIQIFDRVRDARRRLYDVNRRKYQVEVRAEIYVVAMFSFVFFLETTIIALVLYVGATPKRSILTT